jgi:Raf kinase inhibitor-like YbhB/YbcL family protein
MAEPLNPEAGAAPRREPPGLGPRPQFELQPGRSVAIQRVEPRREGAMVITSPAIDIMGWIDPRHSAAENGGSPALAWAAMEDAGAFALIVEDPDAPRKAPFVHWLIWNIPGDATGLAARVPPEIRPSAPRDAVQGKNDAGAFGWWGPKPPPGHGVHRYHFQLFALDAPLKLDPAVADVHALVDAFKDHVLASGVMVGKFETPADTPPRTPMPRADRP